MVEFEKVSLVAQHGNAPEAPSDASREIVDHGKEDNEGMDADYRFEEFLTIYRNLSHSRVINFLCREEILDMLVMNA